MPKVALLEMVIYQLESVLEALRRIFVFFVLLAELSRTGERVLGFTVRMLIMSAYGERWIRMSTG